MTIDAIPRAALVAIRPWLAVGVALIAAACGPAPQPAARSGEGWYALEGTLNASGSRHAIPLGGERHAWTLELSGSLLLTGPSRPGVGFRGEAIGLSDSATGFEGRSVWTDENGDQLYSEVRGRATARGERITGSFVGGTGRYQGATGNYAFVWEYVLASDDGSVQGRGVDLSGRLHLQAPGATAGPAKAQP